MSAALEAWLPRFWSQPDLAGLWRLCTEDPAARLSLLVNVLRRLPPALGSVPFLTEPSPERFVVLFTHDHDNVSARLNESRIVTALAETGLVTAFGNEGLSEELDVGWLRAFPVRRIVWQVSKQHLDNFSLTPVEYLALAATEPVAVWPVEDAELYAAVLESYRGGGADYWSLIGRRSEVMAKKLLERMEATGTAIAGLSVTHHNFEAIHSILARRGVAHVGVSAAREGLSVPGRLDRALRADPAEAGFFLNTGSAP